MPGVRAPLDARTIRAASASHSRLAISRRSRSNLRFGSLSAHVASLCCISLIIKGLHLVRSGSLHSKQFELSPFAMWQAFPAADYYGNSARWTSGSTPLRRRASWAFHHAFPRSYTGRHRIGEVAGRSLFPCFPQVDADAMVWLRSPHDPSRASLHLGSRSDAGRHICPATSSAFHLLSRVDGGDISALRCG